MKKLIVFLLTFFFCSALTIQDIPKNSPDYAYDIMLYKKTQNMRFKAPELVYKIDTQREYLHAFWMLVQYEKEYLTLPETMQNIKQKLSLLKNKKDITSEVQYAYYSKLLDVLNKKYQFYQQNLPVFEKKLYEKISTVVFNTKTAEKNIELIEKKVLEIDKHIEILNINLQKWQLLNDKKNLEKIKKMILVDQQNKKALLRNLLNNYIVIWLNDIKHKNKKAFDDDKKILDIAKQLEINQPLSNIIDAFEKFAFGSKIFIYNTKNEIDITLDKIKSAIQYPLFKVGDRTITPVNFAIFIFVIIIGWIIGKNYKRLVYSLQKRYDLSFATATLLANMGYYTIITLSFLIALKVVGLDLSSLAIIAGALSVGIGFGLQNIVSNFVSGIILMFERSIKVGDYIQIDENTRGEIVDISMRSTVIRTNDNINLIIPNQSFIQNNVTNWTLGDDIVRFRVPFGVAYGSDIDKVEKVILEALEKSKLPYVRKYRNLDVSAQVVFINMGDSALNFELFIWVRGEYARRPRRTRSAFLKLIYNALNSAGIVIPFPQQDLHIKDSVPLEIQIKRS